jgi:hypothetical protein
VCGSDGVTYDNECFADCANADIAYEGMCAEDGCRDDSMCPDGEICYEPTHTCQPECEILCFREDPVCGVDGVTYWCGQADAECHGVEVAYGGACENSCECPTDEWAPVCGSDGVTYTSECWAHCAGVEIAYDGECENVCGCDDVWAPVCGADGNTYANACEARCAGVDVSYEGECEGGCFCTMEYNPVCGTDGNTYGNACVAHCAGVEVAYEGECDGARHCWSNEDCERGLICYPPTQTCEPACAIDCFRYDPVCGTDGNTYGCGYEDAWCNGVEVAYEGECGPHECRSNEDCPRGDVCYPPTNTCEAACEVMCFRYDPVCGEDGVTYGCGYADAWCHGAAVAYEGECDGGCFCTEEYAPVCGADGNTYSNGCFARCAGVGVVHEGECGCTPACDMYCEFGYVVGDDGTCLCECQQPQACMGDDYCKDAEYCNYDYCLPNPYCVEGEPCTDECWGACSPRPACEPLPCDVWCEFGHVLGPDGCPTCTCNEPTACQSDEYCAPGEVCNHDYCLPNPACGDGGDCTLECWGACVPGWEM